MRDCPVGYDETQEIQGYLYPIKFFEVVES